MDNRIIVAGGRDFNNYELLKSKLDYYLGNLDNISIVSGGARGADRLGENYAIEKGLKLAMFPADWNTYGKSAGFIRNKEMAEYSTHLIAFWDGKSKGTKHMIDLAKEYNLKTKIVLYNEG